MNKYNYNKIILFNRRIIIVISMHLISYKSNNKMILFNLYLKKIK